MMTNEAGALVGRNTMDCSVGCLGCDHKAWSTVMVCLWDNWSIQFFVLLSLISQVILAVLGSRRKISSANTIRFTIWASYLLASYFATLALSKLTTVSLDKSKKEQYDSELKALLAPLILLLPGNPDSITAYSVEDNRLGVRHILNLVLTFSFMVWILVRCWKTSIPMALYFVMFVAGIIKYGETIWALYSVYDENTNMREEDFDEEQGISKALVNLPKDVPSLEIFLKAYYRFDCLKPHLVDWLKHPVFLWYRSMSIDRYSPENVFLTTDMELGFMYDVLYTKAPVLYTKPGITLRIISYSSLLLTLGGFMFLLFDKQLRDRFDINRRDKYVRYTFGLLIGVVLLETYQFLKLFYSDWVIIWNTKHQNNPMVLRFLKFLVKRSLKKKRWSNTISQFDFLDFCLSEKQPWHFKILKPFGKAEKFKRYWLTKSVQIPHSLKELLVEGINKLEIERDFRPFTKRGEWSLGIHDRSYHGSLEKLKWSIEMTFDRSIIIWYIATSICNHSCPKGSPHTKASKLISDYMMFLLVLHPQILSLTTAKITYRSAFSKFKTFLKQIPKEQRDKENILTILSGQEYVQENPLKGSLEPVITRGWNVVEEGRRLAGQLKSTQDSSELITSVWIEMLCFAAYNCQQYQHMKLLRRGGEIITHVWLLLSHKTDKFNTRKYAVRNIKIK